MAISCGAGMRQRCENRVNRRGKRNGPSDSSDGPSLFEGLLQPSGRDRRMRCSAIVGNH